MWPVLFMKIHVVCLLVSTAQSVGVRSAQAGIAPSLGSGHGPLSKLDCIKLVVLLRQQIDKLHVSHTQEAKGPSPAHQFRQKLRLGQAGVVAIFLFTEHVSGRRRTTPQEFFVKSHATCPQFWGESLVMTFVLCHLSPLVRTRKSQAMQNVDKWLNTHKSNSRSEPVSRRAWHFN